MADQDEMVARFVELTQSQPETARATLEASNWQLEDALNLFYVAPEDTEDSAAPSIPASSRQPRVEDEMDEDDLYVPQTIHPSAPPAGSSGGVGRTLGGNIVAESSAGSSSARGAAQPPKRRGGMMTLGDLTPGGGHGHDHDDDSDDEPSQDMFAGGEKSGLAIENPNKPGGRGRGIDSVRNILKQAQEGSKARQQQPGDEEDAPDPQSRFVGRGQTLGSDDTPSQVIPDPVADIPKPVPKVTRNLYFWRDGFSIEDGPLMRYDDPANQETLRGIEAGRAPLHLMNVEPGQFTDVNVHKKMEEDYVQPKKKFTPFGGGGVRLGAPTPGFESAGASSSTAPAPSTSTAPAPQAPQTVDVDSSQPTTSVQIRLGDGTRLVSRFNQTHTVAEVYAFINAANTASRSRSYVLQTAFPPKELKDMEQSLKDAGLLNAVVVQKWV